MAYVFRLQLLPPSSSSHLRSPQKRRLLSHPFRLHLSPSPLISNPNFFLARLMVDAIPLRNHSAHTWDSSNHPIADIFEPLRASLQKLLFAVSISFSIVAAWPSSSIAASGGRVGGRAFSSSLPSPPSSTSPIPHHSMDHSFRASSDTSMDYWISSPPPHIRVGVTRASASADNSGMGIFLVMISIYCVAFGDAIIRAVTRGHAAQTAADKTSVIKLQVGLTSMSGPLQKNLSQIAENADTSSLKGLSDLLTETSLVLLRNLNSCIYAYQKAAVSTTTNEVEKCFNKLSIEERGKFDKETLINVDNIKRKPSVSESLMMPNNEYLVITILVAAKGEHTLPVISSGMDLEGALSKLGSIPSREILAVEVLWTPQSEDDSFSEQDLLEKYPLLSPL